MAVKKNRLLYVQKFILEQTDEQHQATLSDILRYLETQSLVANRRTVQEDMGFRIGCNHGALQRDAILHRQPLVWTTRGATAGWRRTGLTVYFRTKKHGTDWKAIHPGQYPLSPIAAEPAACGELHQASEQTVYYTLDVIQDAMMKQR